jgi:hypothetical protein
MVFEKGKPPVPLLPAITLARARALRRDQTDANENSRDFFTAEDLAVPNFAATTLSATSLPISAALAHG